MTSIGGEGGIIFYAGLTTALYYGLLFGVFLDNYLELIIYLSTPQQNESQSPHCSRAIFHNTISGFLSVMRNRDSQQ